MKTALKSSLAIGLTLTALNLPLTALARQYESAPAASMPSDAVAEDVSVTDYLMLIKAYDQELFHSGQARLTANGQRELDRLAADLRAVDYRIVDITGHADPIGSVRRNEDLANKRAAAVRAYLVKRGIDGSRIFTDAQPIDTAGHCAGDRGSALRGCVAPDRSADVKVLASAVVEVTNTTFDQIMPVSPH